MDRRNTNVNYRLSLGLETLVVLRTKLIQTNRLLFLFVNTQVFSQLRERYHHVTIKVYPRGEREYCSIQTGEHWVKFKS